MTLKTIDNQIDFEKGNGLVPVIVQDQAGLVLMLAYTDENAFRLTSETGHAYFWSRKRQELWLKGATSGDYIFVKEIWLDCDRDTLLYVVVSKTGTVCHLGNATCFSKISD